MQQCRNQDVKVLHLKTAPEPLNCISLVYDKSVSIREQPPHTCTLSSQVQAHGEPAVDNWLFIHLLLPPGCVNLLNTCYGAAFSTK